MIKFQKHVMTKREFIVTRNYIRDKKYPDEFTNIINFINGEILKQPADLYDQLNKLRQKDIYFSRKSIARLLSNSNAGHELFSKYVFMLTPSEIDIILKKNMNLWREEDLTDSIDWPLNTEYEFDNASWHSLSQIYNYVMYPDSNKYIGKYELNHNLTVEFAYSMIRLEQLCRCCNFERLAQNTVFSMNDIADIISYASILKRDEVVFDLYNGMLGNPNLTLDAVVKAFNHLPEFNICCELIGENLFVWDFEVRREELTIDRAARGNLLRETLREILPPYYADNVIRYVDYK